MNYIKRFLHYCFLVEKTEKFNQKKFMHNNLCVLVLSIYLTFEQLYYGFFTSAPGSLRQKIFIGTALLMIVYILVSSMIQVRKVKHISWAHKAYEVSLGLLGFLIAVVRALMLQSGTFALPTIYIAVIYGFAVFFYFSPVASLLIYSVPCVFILALLPFFHPEIVRTTYMQDIITNNLIAWIASVISYQRYVREYRSQQTICSKNEELQAKTYKIQKTNQILQYISNVDALTNLYNRRKLKEFLRLEYERCKFSHKDISLIIMDIDYFKSVNDTYGHSVGDKVLEQLGELLRKNVRQDDKVGRWGGEEFLIICPETDFTEAFHLAERLRTVIQDYNFDLRNQLTCSFGVSTSRSMDTISNLISRADKGLYRAKELGRNRVEEGMLG